MTGVLGWKTWAGGGAWRCSLQGKTDLGTARSAWQGSELSLRDPAKLGQVKPLASRAEPPATCGSVQLQEFLICSFWLSIPSHLGNAYLGRGNAGDS